MQLSEQQERKKEELKIKRAEMAAEADIKAYLKTCGKKELIRMLLDLTNAWRDLYGKYEALYEDYEKLKSTETEPETGAQEASKE